MVLLALISGRSTGTRLLADSWLRRKIWVVIWLPTAAPGTASPTVTPALCSLASASGTTLYRLPDSTSVKPCRRNAARNWLMAAARLTGFSVTRIMVPLTRGSTTTSTPMMPAMVRATASISALTKFSVTGSARDRAAGAAGALTTGAACA